MLRRQLFFLLLSVFLVAPAWAQTGGAAIASAHPLATQAGKAVLDRGGNAFDAAVAVAAALGVVESYSSGLGGGGFFLLHRARDGFESVIDARETAPRAATPARYRQQPKASQEGALAAAIPGLPAGLARLAQRYGRLPLSETLAPAIRLAEEGFAIDARYRAMLALRGSALTPAARAQFMIEEGTLKQPALAATLRTLAQRGERGFYRGAVARDLVATVRAAGGVWTLNDLAQYRVIERRPLRFRYRGLRIVSVPPPSAGGVALVQSLQMLERYDLARLGEVERMHLVAEALRRAYHDRRWLGDPAFVSMPLTRLTSTAYATQRAQPIDPANATPSTALGKPEVGREGNDTSHFSIVDRDGNRVAATLSINTPFGSGVLARGILLNNEMDDFAIGDANAYGLAASRANRIQPGKRPLSSMSPTFVEDARGVLVLGTPGGSRIVSMVLLGVLAYAAQPTIDLPALVAAPRFHHQYLPDRIEVEPDAFPPTVLDDLQLKGHVVSIASRPWGNMQAVWVDKTTGKAQAASDPRGQGSGLAWY